MDKAALKAGRLSLINDENSALSYVGRHSIRWARLLNPYLSATASLRRAALATATEDCERKIEQEKKRLEELERDHGVDELTWAEYDRKRRDRRRARATEGDDVEEGEASGSDNAEASATAPASALPLGVGKVRVRRKQYNAPSDVADLDADWDACLQSDFTAWDKPVQSDVRQAPQNSFRIAIGPASLLISAALDSIGAPLAALPSEGLAPPAKPVKQIAPDQPRAKQVLLPLRPVYCAELPVPDVVSLLSLNSSLALDADPSAHPLAGDDVVNAGDALDALAACVVSAVVHANGHSLQYESGYGSPTGSPEKGPSDLRWDGWAAGWVTAPPISASEASSADPVDDVALWPDALGAGEQYLCPQCHSEEEEGKLVLGLGLPVRDGCSCTPHEPQLTAVSPCEDGAFRGSPGVHVEYEQMQRWGSAQPAIQAMTMGLHDGAAPFSMGGHMPPSAWYGGPGAYPLGFSQMPMALGHIPFGALPYAGHVQPMPPTGGTEPSDALARILARSEPQYAVQKTFYSAVPSSSCNVSGNGCTIDLAPAHAHVKPPPGPVAIPRMIVNASAATGSSGASRMIAADYHDRQDDDELDFGDAI